MFETLQEKTEEKAMVQFLERFTDYPFLVKFKNSEYHIGEGEPTFTVNFKKAIPLADLMKEWNVQKCCRILFTKKNRDVWQFSLRKTTIRKSFPV